MPTFLMFCVRTARQSWAPPSSCVRGPTQNAARMAKATAPMGSVTWTAARKTQTAPTPWIQHGKTGQSKQYLQRQIATLGTNPFLKISNFLYHSRLIGSASASVISGEEQFEDYGEGEDVDFTPSSPCPEDDTRTNGFSDLGSSLPSRSVVGLGDIRIRFDN